MRESPHIFISYAQADEARAEEIRARLSAEGLKTLTIGREPLPDDGLEQDARDAIRDSDIFILCLSKNAVGLRGTLQQRLSRELNYLWRGTNGHAFLIPVRLEECAVPESLRAFEYIDLFAEGAWTTLFSEIEAAAARRARLRAPEAAARQSSGPRESPRPKGAGGDEDEFEGEYGELEGPADTSSIFDWRVDLRRLVAGKRDAAIEHLGSVEEYINVNIAEADDEEVAEEAFRHALEALLLTWRPTARGEEHKAARMLELINTYRPPEAFQKVIELVRWVKLFEKTDETGAGEEGDDLRLQGLVALENYYDSPPRPPEDESKAYKSYLSLLEEDLESRLRCGYALRRLVELGVVELSGEKVRMLIDRNPRTLRELVNLLLDENRRTKAERDLRLVYIECLEAGEQVEAEFERAVVSCGGQFERPPDVGPVVYIQKQAIKLALKEPVLFKYHALRLTQGARAGRLELNRMAGAVAGQGGGKNRRNGDG